MQKAIEIQSNGLNLRGMLHVPEGMLGKIPVVRMFHGFTGNRIETHFLFARLSRELEKAGIASLRVDMGGSGESDGEFFDMTISKEVEDAKAILSYARSLDFADTRDRAGGIKHGRRGRQHDGGRLQRAGARAVPLGACVQHAADLFGT